MSQAIALQPRASRSLASAQAASRMMRQSRPVAQVHDDFGASAATVVSVADLFRYFRKRWMLGLLLALPLAAATFAFLGLGKKVYEAESRLRIVIQDNNVFNFQELQHSNVTEVSAPMLVNNHRAELKARSFIDYLYAHIDDADRKAMLEEYAPKATWLDQVKQAIGLSEKAAPISPEDLFATKLELATRVEPLKDSHILRIQLRDEDPLRAARIANHYVTDYIAYTEQQDMSKDRLASVFLKKQAEEVKIRLAESEQKLSEYKQTHGLVIDAESHDVAGEKVKLLTQALADAEVKQSKAKHDMESIRHAQQAGADLMTVKLVGDVPDAAATRKLLEAAQAELANMRVMLGAKHPRVLQQNEKIETLNQQLQNSIKDMVAMVQQEESNSQLQVDDIKKQLLAARGEILANGSKTTEQDILKDQVAADRDLLTKITTRKDQEDLTGQFKENGNLRVSDIAVAPQKPVTPNKPIALLAALMVFGCCFIGIPVGTGFCGQHLMPALRGDTVVAPSAASASLALLPQDSVVAQLPESRHDGGTNLLGEMLRPGTDSADILRDLTSQLEGRARGRQGPGVILVTSAESGEGKTSVSAALAATFCSQGRRVFMIESNAASPSFHLLFPRSYTHTTWNNEMEPLRYGASNLYVLPSQNLPCTELNDMLENYRSWIEKARADVDWIILDGSAMMRNLADITPLLPLATEVLVVHDPACSTAESVNAALNLLRPRLPEHTHCGVVLNRHETVEAV